MPNSAARVRFLIVALALALVASACSASDGGADTAADAGESTETEASTDDAASDGDADDDGAESDAEGESDDEDAADSDAADAATDDVDTYIAPVAGFDYSTIDYDADPQDSVLRVGPIHPSFPPPVVLPSDIVSGGPPPDGIPPIDTPEFVSIADADFIGSDEEPVVVVEIDGDARAYPIQIMIWHEIVNDVIGDVPVTVTYCPLCNSAIAYDRRFGERVLDFGTSGRLYQSALVMYDRQTESLWAHFTGQGLVGHFAGAELTLLPAQTLSFGQFSELYPDGQVLSVDTGFDRAYGANPYEGYDNENRPPIATFISQPIDERLESKIRVVGVVDPAGPIAVSLATLSAEGVVALDEEGRNVVLFHQGGLASALDTSEIIEGQDIGQTGAFVPVTADGTPLTFTATDGGFVDDQTGSTWTINGTAVEGELSGESLERIPHLDTFWFAWATYRPETLLVE